MQIGGSKGVVTNEARIKQIQRNNFQLVIDEANERYNDALKEVERL